MFINPFTGRKMKKEKILHIITELAIGGAQDNTLLTLEFLDRGKYDITLMSAPGGAWEERARQVPGVRVVLLSSLTRPIHPLLDLEAFFRMTRFIRKEGFDIVHTHSSKAGILGRLAAKLAGTPCIIHTIHGFPFHDFMHPLIRRFYILLEKWTSKITDKLITVSKLNQKKAIELGFAPPEQFINIYSGIRYERFDAEVDVQEKRKSLNIPTNSTVVGMVGRLSAQKAPEYFIQAIPHVLAQHPDTQFLLVGDGELRGEIESLADTLSITHCLHILGFREDVPEILSLFDVFVLSSLWEGLGRSLTEALYLKRPVVATRVEGVPELVEDGKTGILVEPKDPVALARGINELISDPSFAQRLGEAGRKRVIADFCAENMTKQITHLYEELCP